MSVTLSILVTWSGLAIAYFTSLPVGFFITTLGFGSYVLARLLRAAGANRSTGRARFGEAAP